MGGAPTPRTAPPTIKTVRRAPPSPHRPSTRRRITVDNILWNASRGSAPRPIGAPCLTIDEALRLGLLPPNAILPTNTQACICYNLVNQHPVICVKTILDERGGPPTGGNVPAQQSGAGFTYGLNGAPTTDPTASTWTSQQITDELSGGFVGAIMDCFAQADPDARTALMAALNDVANFGETTNPEPSASPPRTDTEETTTDSPEARAAASDQAGEIASIENTPTTPRARRTPGNGTADRDPTTQALYDYLKTLVCDLLDWLYRPDCASLAGSTPEDLTAALILAEFCQHTVLDDVMKKMQRCAATPPPEPVPPPEQHEPPVVISQGGCACQAWPGWVICPNCAYPGTLTCTCQGHECIPFPASARNC